MHVNKYKTTLILKQVCTKFPCVINYSFNFLFVNNHIFTDICKDHIESSHIPFIQFPQDCILCNCGTISNKEIDIGIICVQNSVILSHLYVLNYCCNQYTKLLEIILFIFLNMNMYYNFKQEFPDYLLHISINEYRNFFFLKIITMQEIIIQKNSIKAKVKFLQQRQHILWLSSFPCTGPTTSSFSNQLSPT